MMPLSCPLGPLIDLSVAGMRVRCSDKPPIAIGQQLDFAVQSGPDRLRITGKIAWLRRTGLWRHEFGVEYSTITVQLASLACYGRLAGSDGGGAPLWDETSRITQTDHCYQLLGVPRTASAAMVRSAYHKLARKYHPDANPEGNGDEHFKLIREAYEVVKDQIGHKAFDEMICPRSVSSAEAQVDGDQARARET